MVEGYVGLPGQGKTCSMVWSAWNLKRRFGRRIRSNIPLVDRRGGSPTYGMNWADGEVIETLEEAMGEDNCTVLLDEVHVWAPSQEWAKVPAGMKIWLAQHRKNGLDIWWTAQSAGRVYNVVRELTATVWNAKRYGPLTIMDGSDPETKEKMGRRYLLIRPEVFNLYDTAFMVGTADGRGRGRGSAAKYAHIGGELGVPMVEALVRKESGGYPCYQWARIPQSDVAALGDKIMRTRRIGGVAS